MKRRAVTALFAAVLVAGTGLLGVGQPPVARAGFGSIPVLAYYYIWFDASSWERAKIDYPVLGRYSSDDANVMEKQVEWAKAAGIDGFIVSWKSTPKLNARLDQLVGIASRHDFKLAVIYEALDFGRQPLPPEQIRDELRFFTERWGSNPVFGIFDKPMVILSGTWEFTPAELELIIGDSRQPLLVLATERNADAYETVARLVDGNAYYWSSVNPDNNPGYPDKLARMSGAIHAHRGIWIAPAAPGFDARLVGGTSVVERNDGDTLRAEVGAALQSSPDAVGVISWNEFSENTHIEPSVKYGGQYLQLVAELAGSDVRMLSFDSDEPGEAEPWVGLARLSAFGGLAVIVVLAGFAITRRGRTRSGAPLEPGSDSSPGDSRDGNSPGDVTPGGKSPGGKSRARKTPAGKSPASKSPASKSPASKRPISDRRAADNAPLPGDSRAG